MTPKLMASSFDRRATFFVRLRQMTFSVRSVSYSSTRRGKLLDEGPDHPLELGGHLFREAPYPDEAGGEARPCHVLHDAQDGFPLAERVEEEGHGADVEGMRAYPYEVAGDPLQLREDHAQVLRPLRRIDAAQALRREAVGEVVREAVRVVEPVGKGKGLLVCPGLGELFDAAMEVPYEGRRLDDDLAVELEKDPQDPVRGGVLRTHVDGHILFFFRHRRFSLPRVSPGRASRTRSPRSGNPCGAG